MARRSWRVSRNGPSRRSPNCWTDPVNDVRCRPAAAEDFTFLATMLGEAAVWRPDKPTPTADQVLADPRYAMYLAGWPRQGDYGLVAEQDGPLGAAWYRTYTEASHGYGFVAEDVPELSIAVIASRRHEGIGRRLLIDLINASVDQGYPALSLSVARRESSARPLRVGRLRLCREARIVLDDDPTRRSIKLSHYRRFDTVIRRKSTPDCRISRPSATRADRQLWRSWPPGSERHQSSRFSDRRTCSSRCASDN